MKKTQSLQHSKIPLRVPPQSPSISSASTSSSSSSTISSNLQKIPSEQFLGQKLHKPKASTSPKQILTSSNRSHLIKHPSQVSQVSHVTQQKQESSTPKSSSIRGQHNQNLNKLNRNISPSKKEQPLQQSFQSQNQVAQQTQQGQTKKKQQQPNIQKPILNSKVSNRNSNNRSNSLKFDPTSNLPPTHSPDFHYIFERKIEICSRPLLLQNYYNDTFHLKNSIKINSIKEEKNLNSNSKLSSNLEEIQLKTLNLNHILQLVNENSNKLKDDEQNMIIDMVMKNILRPFKYMNPNLLFAEESLILPDPEWPHLEIIYLILNQMQANFPIFLKYDFCRSFFTVFNSSDENERIELVHFFTEYIKVHCEFRNDLMKDLTNLLNMHIELSDRPFVVLTVLPIFKEICMLSEQLNFSEYDKEIRTSIIPLLRDKYSFYFITLIDDILSYYSDGKPQNARLIVEYLLKYWPQTSTTKQSYYTTFLAEMLHELNQEDLCHFLRPVLKLFESEIVSASSKLAESSLSDLEQIIESFGEEANETILEIMVPSIMRSVNDHWWDGIRNATKQIMTKIFEKNDINVLKNVAVNSLKKSNDEIRSKYNGWNEIFKTAKQNDSEIRNSIDKKEKQLEILFSIENSSNYNKNTSDASSINDTDN